MKTGNLAISNHDKIHLNTAQKLSIAIGSVSLLIYLLAILNVPFAMNATSLVISSLGLFASIWIYSRALYKELPPGIKNNGVWFKSISKRGGFAWGLGIIITGFYILLYWFPSYLGLATEGGVNSGIVALFDPLAMALKGSPASQWFMYGSLYTMAILSMGIKFIYKYRHSQYQIIRTISVMLFQLLFAYLIPEIMESLSIGGGGAYFSKDLKNFWPLNYYFFEPWHLDNMGSSNFGMFYLFWGILGFAILTPILTYFLGKRWYCSWVCGCGGLAETAGDPFRHLSSKKLKTWKLERWLIHGVLVYIILVTVIVLYGYLTGTGDVFGLSIYHYFSKPYGFLIGAAFSGVIGVGFYPVLGSRVWCRFGCPMAAYMGLFQRFKSRFRISTNGGQCISCGNCSTYCEQGIDVRWYAQRGQNIVRSSCVGCGICSEVCPRGVLKLENGPELARTKVTVLLVGNDSFGAPK